MPHKRPLFWLLTLAAVGIVASMLYSRVDELTRRAGKYVLVRVTSLAASDMRVAMARIVAEDSARFVLREMPMAAPYDDKFALFNVALDRVDPKLNGLYCEFGVYTGGTINYIASRTSSVVHGFDSFEGLPEAWRAGFATGAFAIRNLPGVRPNVRLYKGWFKDTLPVFKKDHPEPLAFGHLDADLYVSTRDVFEALGDRIVAGTILQFDEYVNYPGWQEGEKKAFEEFCAKRHAEVEFFGYVPTSQQVAVKIKKIDPPGSAPAPLPIVPTKH
ncbi:MAG: class I SAM-dependent methyltransferase [Bryobacterales bacterium]|nr:class I SAM-dependent methyltransferase [Bryobacterales bacterium]